ncbi:MAG: UbiA family prenyltransferase [Candidatus Delongbacteria bacterium]
MRSYLKILRPFNLLITAFASIVAYVIVAEKIIYANLSFIVLSTVLTAAAGNIINDIIDIDIDILNKPHRPLPSGNMTVGSAYVLYVLFVAGSIISGFFLGYHSAAAVILVNFILLFYTVFLKRRPFWGNFIVAFISGYLFYFCSITTGNFTKIIPLAVSAFLFHFIREIIKDVSDIKGDRKNNARTMAVKLGIKKTVRIIVILIFTLIIYLGWLMLSGHYNSSFTAIIIFSVFPVMIYVLISLFKKGAALIDYEKLSLIMKADMVFGILAFYFGLA